MVIDMDYEPIVREVVTATVIIFGAEIVCYTIMEILIVIMRVATMRRKLRITK